MNNKPFQIINANMCDHVTPAVTWSKKIYFITLRKLTECIF